MIDFLHNRDLSDLWVDADGRICRTRQYRISDELARRSPTKVPGRLWGPAAPERWWKRLFTALGIGRRPR